MKTFKFYSDAGHGWLAVKKSLLEQMGIMPLITSFSYQSKSGSTIYLEEDADASRFINALKALNVPFQLVEVDHGDRSWVRNLPRVMNYKGV